MVIQERKLVTISEAEKIYREANGDVEKAVDKLRSLNRRRNHKAIVPEGGITLRKAESSYKIPCRTLSRWAKRLDFQEYVPILAITPNSIYLDKSSLDRIIKVYKSELITGHRTITKAIAILKSQNN